MGFLAAERSKKAANGQRGMDMASDESKGLYRTRAGTVATCSIGKGTHGMGRLRKRGIPRASPKNQDDGALR
jgi:hypothetical protein